VIKNLVSSLHLVFLLTSGLEMAEPAVLVKSLTPTSSIVKITLNRPKALNALNVELLTGLVDALRENQKAQVIILEGAGDRSFCAGEDLKQTLAPKARFHILHFQVSATNKSID